VPTRHVIEVGDSVVRLAKAHGFLAETVWDAPDNADLRSLRHDMNTLMPGDVLTIPDKTLRSETIATGQTHRVRLLSSTAYLRMQLYDFGEPRADQEFSLQVGARTIEGTTDGDGVLEVEVPAEATRGQLTIGEDKFEVEILFGHLDPPDQISGTQQRLTNLGFTCHDTPGELGEDTRAALLAFQRAQQLEPTGERDDKTLARLSELHDEHADSTVVDQEGSGA
jgi:hypothetical protein